MSKSSAQPLSLSSSDQSSLVQTAQSPQQILPALLDNAYDAIALIDDQGCFIDANTTACHLFGIPRPCLIGRALSTFLIADQDGHIPDLEPTVSCLGELTIATANGKRDMEYTITPQVIPQGHLLLLRDISQRKATMQAEAERQRQQVELFAEVTFKIRQSLHLKEILHTTVTEVQRILQADRVLIYQVLPNGIGKTISEAVLPPYPQLIDWEFPAEVLPDAYHHLYAAGRVRAIADVQDPTSGLADCLIDFVKQFGIKAKLIVPIVQNVHAYPQGIVQTHPPLWGLLIAHQCSCSRHWKASELELMQHLANQISIALAQAQLLEHLEEIVEARTAELSDLNRTLHQQIHDREAIERMKDEFLAIVSHELRTPLTSLHSALKILATGQLGTLSPQGQHLLQIADDNTERLVRLVTNVLDLQRIESGQAGMSPKICNAATLLIQAAETMQAMAFEHGVEILTHPQTINVWADADYIVQTLTNLISNAIKFSAPGGTVCLSVQAVSTEILFQVQDHGQGIPADQIERIFERFQQVDSSDSRKKGGSGLGLTICRKIIEQHHGKIWAESSPGSGSTFFFTLPPDNPADRPE